MLSGAGQVSHFSFCKVNSGITVFKLQSNLPGMRFLMRLIGRRGTWQIMSRGVCAKITSLSFFFSSLSPSELLCVGISRPRLNEAI